MFEAFFSDPDLIYRINVINSIDFYSLGFEMGRGETTAENMLQWPRKGEVADVLVTNVQCPDMSGFELAETVRKYCPRVRVIFLADTPNCAIAQQVVRFGAYDFLLKSDGIDALRLAVRLRSCTRKVGKKHICATRPIGMRLFQSSCACLRPCGRKSAKSIGSCTPESSRWFPMIHSASRRCWCVR